MASVTLLPPATRLLGCAAIGAAAEAIGRAFGVALPRDACRVGRRRRRAALWLGPDEWLLIAPDGEAEALMRDIDGALDGAPASLVDVSDRQVGIDVVGPEAAEAINAFNALDLDIERLSGRHVHAHDLRQGGDRAVADRRRTASGSRCGAPSRPMCSAASTRRPANTKTAGIQDGLTISSS